MGGGASKKSQNAVQQKASVLQSVEEIKPPNRSPIPPQSPRLSTVQSRQPSIHSRTSSKQSIPVLTNGNGYRTPCMYN